MTKMLIQHWWIRGSRIGISTLTMWRSKCFKLPMPGEREMNLSRDLETEVQTLHSDTAIDTEVKPEGPAQKRSGLAVELIKEELYGISHGLLHGSCQQSFKEAGGRLGASETPPNLPGFCLLQVLKGDHRISHIAKPSH
ncbi:hypothetical protein C4D60_Mb01t05710 [Musa balbisiana]|uniref:Uncharacterized protein n=1 Tax=Musa balbisiana TaxID=52838 RepID=A0A4S8JKC1_MUSBA|nr:hypothetical protein C4D60_Mb01t05710 [Musa balbisiana]